MRREVDVDAAVDPASRARRRPWSGAVRSILTGSLVAWSCCRPCRDTDAVAVWLSPSVDRTESAGPVAGEPGQGVVGGPVRVTSALYQPCSLGAVVGAALRVGGVLSMLMPLTVVLARVAGVVGGGAVDLLVGALAEVLRAGDGVDAGQPVLGRRTRP